MDRYFVDSDVILDFVLDRSPYNEASTQLMNLGDRKIIKLHTSSIAISNVHYIGRKYLGTKRTLALLQQISDFIEIESVGKAEVLEAFHSKFSDFEDALQYAAAIKIRGLKALVTRNVKDYKLARIAVTIPKDLISTLK